LNLSWFGQFRFFRFLLFERGPPRSFGPNPDGFAVSCLLFTISFLNQGVEEFFGCAPKLAQNQ
jgi:hypothetical protein